MLQMALTTRLRRGGQRGEVGFTMAAVEGLTVQRLTPELRSSCHWGLDQG
jgi:hypothetical protein